MPEFNPDEPFEVASFDPTKPFEAPKFDPDQPFDVGIPVIEAEPLERREAPKFIMGRDPIVHEMGEPGIVYRKRAAEHFGFSEPPPQYQENYERLQEALGITRGRPENMQMIVEKAFGGDAKLKFHKGYGEHVIEFKTGEIVPFNPPGLDIGDIRGMKPAAYITSAEMAAGGAGALGGAGFAAPGMAIGGVLGAPIGAGIARYQLLKMGKDQGFEDATESEMLGEAIAEYAFSLGAEATLGTIGAIGRRFLGSPQAKRFIGVVPEKNMDEAIRIAEELFARTEARTGVKMESSAGQQLMDVDVELGRQVQKLERGAEARGGQVGQFARKTQVEAEEALSERLFGSAGDAAEFGEAVQRIAAADVGREAENIAKESIGGQIEAMARREIDVDPTYKSVEDARRVISKSRDKIFDHLGKKYDDFWERVPEEITTNLAPLKKVAREWAARIDRDIAPMMTEESGKLMEQVMSSKETSLDSVSRFVTTLKAEMRSMDTVSGMAKTREKKPLVDLLSELEKARGEALEGVSKGMRDELADIDRSYRIAKETLDLGLVNRLITRSKGGGFRIADKNFFKTILENSTESKNIAALLASPEFASTGGLKTAKDGIMGMYRDQVVKGEMTHTKFISKYGESLKQFFSPQEMRRFSSLEKAEAFIRLSESREKELIKELRASFGYSLGKYDPEEVAKVGFGSETGAKKLREILENHPDEWATYKNLRSQKLYRDVRSMKDGRPYINHDKLFKRLDTEKKELTETFGKQYVDDLELLVDIARLRKIPKGMEGPLTDALRETDSGPIMMMWRAGPARPLSRPGLMTTAGSKLYKSGSLEATAKLLQKPKNLRDAMRLYNRGAPWKQWRRFWLNIGAIELVRAIEEGERDESTEVARKIEKLVK